MPWSYLICNYCDHKWEGFIIGEQYSGQCPKCNDKSIKAIAKNQTIDYYKGSKPFPDGEPEYDRLHDPEDYESSRD